MKIAIIGSNISGLVAAYLLSQNNEVTLYQKKKNDVNRSNENSIVFSDNHKYINKIINHLNLEVKNADIKKTSNSITNLQNISLLNPKYWKFNGDLKKFTKNIQNINSVKGQTISGLLKSMNIGESLHKNYILPIARNLGNYSDAEIMALPSENFIKLYNNIPFDKNQRWIKISAGNDALLDKLSASIKNIRTGIEISKIMRFVEYAEIRTIDGNKERFDQLIISGDINDSLAILGDADVMEKEILSKFQNNETKPTAENLFKINEAISHLPKIQGSRRTWFCRSGDRFFYPEDSIKSAFTISSLLGADILL